MQTTTAGCCKYVVTFIDDYLPHVNIRFMKAKPDGLLSLPDFVPLSEVTQTRMTDPTRHSTKFRFLPIPPVTSLNKILRVGVQPRRSNDKPQTQQHGPPNHNSAVAHADAMRRHIGKGQRDDRYIGFSKRALSLRPELFISSIGVVDKEGGDTRMINEYSFPNMGSMNDFTDPSNFPTIAYNPPRNISRHITFCALNVSGAFRHVPIHKDDVHSFIFMFNDYVIIDLSCGFGWCGSLSFYSLAGSVISDSIPVHDDTLPIRGRLRGNVWCDDLPCLWKSTTRLDATTLTLSFGTLW
ncbi:hypothetical protein PHMEG_0008222 [Phytophthora megakarya]|uniref:Uncharacterized protein n=1 Tax=Phytophthora megakarya TaxID=4795 RepID=A0A225WJ97_9STRA|nr:hypothetical protein PHMEG_0008222 [Phytophthora megakarya]